MKITNPTIKQLMPIYKEMSLLGRVSALLNWDLNVNLPPQAAASRGEQSAYITNLVTQKWLEPDFRKLLEKANKQTGLQIEEKAILRNLNYASKYYYNVPKELIIKREQVTSEAFPIWAQARSENNFKKFLPFLSQIVEISQQTAKHLGYKHNPYDALLDLYEPELTTADCQIVFAGLKAELVPMIKKITKSKNYVSEIAFLQNDTFYPIADQEKLLYATVRLMGFDLSRGRIDTSAHPFTIGLAKNDIRFTTFYNQKDFRESFTSAMHEAGHGLYEQGVNPEYAETPLGGGVSLGVHEALSRFWENMVGKNPVFLRHMMPLLRLSYEKQFTGISDQAIINSFNAVRPSLIRIHADEVTYSLHIILRFEMENAILNEKIKVKDVADVWREKAKQLLGVTSTSDTQGVLQDVHWTYGDFGYFPSYALGNLYGAQFLNTMEKEFNVDKTLQMGNLRPIKDWLDNNIHQHGSLYFPKDLVKKVTGKPLNHSYFVTYLNRKYSSLYPLS